MISVTLTLEDGQERAGFERLMRDLDAYRAQKYAAGTMQTQGSAPVDVEFTPTNNAPVDEQPAEVVGEIIPKVEVGTVPSEDQIMAAVRNYLRANDLPKTLAMLQKHGVQKATDPMTDEVKVALFAELTK
jgi:hypothetical protein